MGEEEDPQKLKKIAASAYDYENDPRWADYWSNILIPPHMASRSDVVDHFKRKFYQRYLDPDLVVEPMPTGGTSQPTQSSALPPSTPGDQSRPRSSGASARTSGTPAASAANAASLRWDRQTIQFSVNAWVFVVAVLAIFPLVPRILSNRAYRLSFMGTACSSFYSFYSLYGTPRAWNLQTIQVWFQSVVATKDFIYFIYGITFVTSNLYLKCWYLWGSKNFPFPCAIKSICTCFSFAATGLPTFNVVTVALIPILCRSLEHIARFLRRNFTHSSLYRKYLEEPCVWVESNTTTLSILSSQAEIGLGFLLIISLFSSQRNIIQTFMYWQLLKLMYHAPVTAGYHQSVWAKIGRSVNPLVSRYAPFFRNPISAIKSWFLRT